MAVKRDFPFGAKPAVDDLNHDGVVNVVDVLKLMNAIPLQ